MLTIKNMSNNELASMYQSAQRASQKTQKVASATAKAQLRKAEFDMHRSYYNMVHTEGVVRSEYGIEFRQSVNTIHSIVGSVVNALV